MVVEIKSKAIGDDLVITFVEDYKKYWFFGPTLRTATSYRGSCTVWHEYPSGKRCSTAMEECLCALWHRYQWEKDK